MSAIWVADVQSSIYTIVTTRAKKNLIDDFKNIVFTSEGESDVTPQFPTVYIHEMPFAETGNDLQGTSINGAIIGFQIDVTVTKTQGKQKALRVAYEVLEQFKKLRFQMVSSPEFIKTGGTDTKQLTFRVRRTVGADDVIK